MRREGRFDGAEPVVHFRGEAVGMRGDLIGERAAVGEDRLFEGVEPFGERFVDAVAMRGDGGNRIPGGGSKTIAQVSRPYWASSSLISARCASRWVAMPCPTSSRIWRAASARSVRRSAKRWWVAANSASALATAPCTACVRSASISGEPVAGRGNRIIVVGENILCGLRAGGDDIGDRLRRCGKFLARRLKQLLRRAGPLEQRVGHVLVGGGEIFAGNDKSILCRLAARGDERGDAIAGGRESFLEAGALNRHHLVDAIASFDEFGSEVATARRDRFGNALAGRFDLLRNVLAARADLVDQ